MNSAYEFIIDTEQYSGNFERELCAYMTGQIGGCEKGLEDAEIARQEIPEDILLWLQMHITRDDDDNDCHCFRPVAIAQTPGWFNDGIGNHWREGADPALVKAKFEETVLQSYQRRNDPDMGSRLAEGPDHFGAYLSVSIHLLRIPPESILTLLMQRARDFNNRTTKSEWVDNITVTGFRLIENNKSQTQIWSA